MAYGVIMGQTPILSAGGIEYDNSQTASVITGNNVQQAIDESVKKIESVESNGLSWELIYENSHKGDYLSNSSTYRYPIIQNILSEKNANNYFMIMLKANSTIYCSNGRSGESFYLMLSEKNYNKYSEIQIAKSSGNNKNTTQILIPLYYNGGYKNESNSYYPAYGSSDNKFEFGNSLFVYASYGSRNISVDTTLQIYGLKAPI